MKDEDKYDQIEQYLDGLLSAENHAEFEQQLAGDVALKQEVDLHRQVADTLRGEKVHQLRHTINEVDKSWTLADKAQTPESDATIFRLRLPLKKMLAVAATLLALVFAYQTFVPKENLSAGALFADNFTPYKMVLNQRSATAENDLFSPELAAAITAYENKDFAQAATLFKELPTTPNNKITLTFYHALAELAQENAIGAIPLLQQVLATPDHLFVEQSRWYLALAYLQAENTEATKTQLRLIEKGSFKYSEAQDLLSNLEK